MKMKQESGAVRNVPPASRCRIPGQAAARCSRAAAFTLIEIMIVVGILAIIMAIAIPSVYQQMQKDAMRQAVSDVIDACGHARARAILDGTVCEVTIRVPPNGSVNVTATGKATAGTEFTDSDAGERPAGGSVFSAKFQDRIVKVDAMVFEAADRNVENEVVCKFYPNGTCDAMRVELASDRNEVRIITTDVVTGIADVEVVR
jgi:prepilin-type N-terminal cleavage/methylation domain-containing protein